MDSCPLSWAVLGELLRLAWGGGLGILTRSVEESQGDQDDGDGELHGGQEAGGRVGGLEKGGRKAQMPRAPADQVAGGGREQGTAAFV